MAILAFKCYLNELKILKFHQTEQDDVKWVQISGIYVQCYMFRLMVFEA